MRRHLTRTTRSCLPAFVGAVAAALVAATPAAATPGPGGTAGTGGTGGAGGTDCTASVVGVSGSGRWVEHSYDAAGEIVETQGSTDPKLPFTPTAMVAYSGASDMESWVGIYWATDADGALHQLTRTADKVGGVDASRHEWTVVSTDFGATRGLAWSYPYLFQLTSDGLVRHTISDDGVGPRVGTAVAVPGDWAGAATVTVARRAKVDGSTRFNATVLLGTRTNGGLFEVTVPDAQPTRTTVALLHPTALPDLRSLSVAPCGTDGRLLVAAGTDGAVRVVRDARADDGSGADLSGIAGAPAETGWRDATYSG